jgi:hypothetical protein
VALLCALPRCRAAPQGPQLDLPITFWADVDGLTKDIISPRTRCPPSKSCPPAVRQASDTASSLTRYCRKQSESSAAGEAVIVWERCAAEQSSEWLLVQPYYKDPSKIVHRFEHLLPLAQASKHEQSLPDWAALAPYPRQWKKLVCVPDGSAFETATPLEHYHEVSSGANWYSQQAHARLTLSAGRNAQDPRAPK